MFPCQRSRLRVWSHETDFCPASACSLPYSGQSGAYLRDSSRVPRRRPLIYFKPPYAIGSVPSLSGHIIAYQWRSLPRVRRHRASKPQDSFERVLTWQVTTDQLLCVCVCVFFPFILDIKFVGRTSRGHTGFLIHLLSAVRDLIFLARRIQPLLSLVDREVDFCVLTIFNRSPPVGHRYIYFLFFSVRKFRFAGIELTSHRVRRLHGYL